MVELTQGLLVAYTSIVVMAVVPILIGAHLSLKQKVVEKMTSKDAWLFPIVGSIVLFSLYVVFKVFSKDYINLLLKIYFVVFGVGALSATISSMITPLLYTAADLKNKKTGVSILFVPPFASEQVTINFNTADVLSFFASFFFAAWYFVETHWLANNAMGFCFSVQAIALLSLGSYKNGFILLSLLFFYDVFWVFGTDVMVSVARSFNGPIKLLFPKDIFASEFTFSMLGLGDIVIPGIFIALMLKFDELQPTSKRGFWKFYFTATMVAYVLGLVSTMVVMHTFQAAQPALLYLVPFCLGASIITALVRGELTHLAKFQIEDENAPHSAQADKKAKGGAKKEVGKEKGKGKGKAEGKKEKDTVKEKEEKPSVSPAPAPPTAQKKKKGSK